ncbi:hypothetical protein E4N62_19285 [Streptomyces sp. MNU76]|nr:hypothetical protein [Streptomyces sp. MNU76]
MNARTAVAAASVKELLSSRPPSGTTLSTAFSTTDTYEPKAQAKETSSAAMAQVPVGRWPPRPRTQ